MYQQQEFDSQLAGELDEGEQVLWSAHPITGRALSGSPGRVYLILAIVFGSVGLLMLVVGLILLLALRDGAAAASVAPFIIGGTFLFLTLMFGIFAIVFNASPRGTFYAITERRIIVITRGRFYTVDSYSRDDIGRITRMERPDGSGDLIFAQGGRNAAGAYGYNYGNYNAGYGGGTYSPSMMNTGRFVGIANVRTAEQLVRRTFKQ
jgi:hypothetical protein